MKFFSYDGYTFHTHATAQEAKTNAENALDEERAEAGEGWSEYVTKICWGEIKEHIVEEDFGPSSNDEFDREVDMHLRPVE